MIAHDEMITLWGSCFADELHSYLYNELCHVSASPFGIAYNPLSMAEGLSRALSGERMREEELFCLDGLWHSSMHHGKYSGRDKAETLERMNAALEAAQKELLRTRLFVFTFGTAYLFEEKKTGQVVNNCHKRPSWDFVRRRASVSEITERWLPPVERLLSVVPDSEILFTVSPIPHYRDGSHGNRVSKSVLHLAVDEILTAFPGRRVHYFPAYEIMQDELRDYRFYESDFAHPTRLAVDYIMERFSEHYLAPWEDEEEWHKVRALLGHRPLTEVPRKLRDHYYGLSVRLEALRQRCPHPLLDEAIKETERHYDAIQPD